MPEGVVAQEVWMSARLIAVCVLATACMEVGLTSLGDKSGPVDTGLAEPSDVDTGVLDPDDTEPTEPSDTGTPTDDTAAPPAAEPCSGVLRTVRWEVDFPERSGCGWEEDGNLEPLDAFVQAVEHQSVSVPLDGGGVVCDVRFEFGVSQGGMTFPLRYDDQLLLSLNDRVIFSSDQDFIPDLETDSDGLVRFDWLAVRGRPMNFTPTAWALGDDYVLEFPGHDVEGVATVAIADEDLSTLRSSATDALEFELWAFGDNDVTDCGHSGLGFWVEVEVDGS